MEDFAEQLNQINEIYDSKNIVSKISCETANHVGMILIANGYKLITGISYMQDSEITVGDAIKFLDSEVRYQKSLENDEVSKKWIVGPIFFSGNGDDTGNFTKAGIGLWGLE